MSEAASGAESVEQRRTRKRRLMWAAVGLAVLVTLVLAPPLVNANRLARRIADNMSQSLGRPVHLDSVTLNVLPVPGFTLQNLVVSEDPSFGAEPVIRANTVTATLRVSSLWRRQVEFGTIRFQDPSVNLVRRADGRWNLESILIHAAQQDAAPTAQTEAGPAPRFPYIEATGARVNVKLGDAKQPWSLTEADFALWLPSPQQWRVRLEAKPARTDTSVSDTGLLTVEATLDRAAKLADVPIDLAATWRRAPLGEASKLFTGSDAEWRGTVEATATAHGTLGDALVNGRLKLSDVRRADFIPAKMLHLDIECSGHLAVTTAVMREPSCTTATRRVSGNVASDEASGGAGVIAATADTLDLTGLHTSGLRVGMSSVPDAWVLDWARLFSQRIPADLTPHGLVSGSLARAVGPAEWQGEMHDAIEMQDSSGAATSKDVRTETRTFSVVPNGSGFNLNSVNIAPMGAPPLMLTGIVSGQSFSLQMTGTATPDEITKLRGYLPPLGDGLDSVVPALANSSAALLKVDVSCTRAWGAEQTCVAARVAPPTIKRPKRRR